ncbi:MAG: hypothetical protein IJ715_01850 [Bacilli bacterium]|nr:hypothetical protein [Bacilli bacterium]
MDTNFEIMKAMNYAYDNPNNREQVNIHETLVDISKKSVINPNVAEAICSYASLSSEENAYLKAMEGLKTVKTIDNGMNRVRTM